MVNVSVETITPETALSYLNCSDKNRKIRPRAVDMIARDITNGNFETTNQGIGFNEDGEFVDGHHRLLAVVKSGKAVDMQVTRGMSRKATLAIDRGETRSVRDILDITSDHDEASKAVYDRKMVSAVNQLVVLGYNQGLKLSANEILDIFRKFSDSIVPLYSEVFSKSSAIGNTAPVIAAAIAAVICGTNVEYVERFFEVLNRDDISGCDDYNVRAALNWKRQLYEAKSRHIRIDKKKLFLGTQNAIFHFVNNTDTATVRVPDKPRYDVKEVIKTTITELESR